MSTPEASAAGGDGRDKRAWTEEVLSELLKLMGVRARIEVKDTEAKAAENGVPAQQAGISVAVFPEEEVQGLASGKRSPVADSLQFIANKIVNRGPEKKWISIGIGGHPPPKQAPPQKQPKDAAAAPGAGGGQDQAPTRPQRGQKGQQQGQQQQRAERAGEQAAGAPAQAQGGQGPQPQGQQGGRGARGQRRGEGPAAQGQRSEGGRQEGRASQIDESKLEVSEDPAMTRLGRMLAEKAAAHGRIYAVVLATPGDRARLGAAAKEVADVSVKYEGEGRHRRVVVIPANAKPMPKKTSMPDYDDEEDLDEE